MRSIKRLRETSNAAASLARLAERLKAASRWPGSALPALWMMSDEERLPDPVPAARRLPPGSGVVLRHYRHPDRAEIAHALAVVARERGLRLFIGADTRLATTVQAHGVHLPRWTLKQRPSLLAHRMRILHGVRLITTASAHNVRQVAQATMLGVDSVFVSPVFPTASHPGSEALGIPRLAALAHAPRVPVIALGGIGLHNAQKLIGTGVAGLAAVGVFATDE